METNCFIKVNHANLLYPSKTYNALTLKEEVFRALRMGKRSKLLCDVHALKDLNFEIHEGERVGVIGRNGAGKSTLLKAMAGLYPLQSGEIITSGRIRALFELSLGFEFEATGRENIIYRGLLLGETPKSIREKEQAIIEFAGLNEFIDYPIKSYSGGMLVRLAFAISTTIAGDILLLDEVFGAGDLSFFQKARQRMYELIDQAKIIVFVSHDLGTIREICNRCIYLESGRVVMDGKTNDVVDYYINCVKTAQAGG